MRDAVRAFGLIPIEQEGFEDDDIIATYAREAVEAGADATIISGDKDLMQLVRPGVGMFDPMPGRERPIGIEEVIEKFGVPPAKVHELQPILRDSTDNVPGVPGIGVKTAAQLINEYGDLETLLKRASEIKQEKRRQSLIEFAEQARLSKRLRESTDHVTTKVPLDRLCLEGATCLEGADPTALIAFIKAMEFPSLLKRVSEQLGIDPSKTAPDARLAAKGIAAPEAEILAPEAEVVPPNTDLFEEPRPVARPRGTDEGYSPENLVTARRAEAANSEFEHARYDTVNLVASLDAWIARAVQEGVLALAVRTTSPDPMQAETCGTALAVRPNEASSLPLAHRASDDLLAGGGLSPGQIPADEALARLKPVLEHTGVLTVGQDHKSRV